MKLTIFLFLIISFSVCYGQAPAAIDNKFCIKLNPLALIDVYGGYSYRLGTEFKIHNNIAASIEYGKYFSFPEHVKIDLKQNSSGYIVNPELKLYLNKSRQTAGKFMSLNYVHKEIKFDYQDSIKSGANPVYEKKYTIFKNISCLTVKYGNLKVYKKRFVSEWFLGLGVRFSNGYNTLTSDENNGVLTGENHGDLIGYGQRAINYVLPNFSLGFKLGYSFD